MVGRRMMGALNRLRDGVLRGARLRSGQRVLDGGAGTGLIALGARWRVRPAGRVIALDISRDALRLAAEAARADEGGPPVEPICAGVLDLPFADASFDGVFTRSVLIYVADKPAAVRELSRVLRPAAGGDPWRAAAPGGGGVPDPGLTAHQVATGAGLWRRGAAAPSAPGSARAAGPGRYTSGRRPPPHRLTIPPNAGTRGRS